MSTKSKIEKEKNTTASTRRRQRVFIFGAGASAACGIAVAKDLLREAIVRLEKIDAEKANRVHSLLKYLYPGFRKLTLNYPNIEDFLNLLEMGKRFNSEEFIKSSLWSVPKIEEVEGITLKAVTDYIWGHMQRNEGLEVMNELVREHIRTGDTFITFNWDLTLERALSDDREISFWYSYKPAYTDDSNEISVNILKPHGSIDWFRKTDLSNKRLKGKVSKLDEDISVFTRFDFSEAPEMANCTPVIVPPISTKSFSYDILKRSWRDVYRAVSKATHLIIIGYSLPNEDQFARLVLGRALRNNRIGSERKKKPPVHVTIVNPDEKTETTFRRLLGPDVHNFEFYQATFRDFLAYSQQHDDD